MKMFRWSGSDALWLAGQGVLFVLVILLIPALDGGPGAFTMPGSSVIAGVAFVGGWVLLLASFVTLGRQLVPQPTPVEEGQLVDRGPYGVVRHPIYTAVLLILIGILARTPSVTGLVVAVAALAFFDAKSAHEERLLAEAYDEYEDYRRRVRFKLLPGLR